MNKNIEKYLNDTCKNVFKLSEYKDDCNLNSQLVKMYSSTYGYLHIYNNQFKYGSKSIQVNIFYNDIQYLSYEKGVLIIILNSDSKIIVNI